MTNKAMKYGLMTIAVVLLVAMAFAGAASAASVVEITAEEWNGLTTSDQINGNETYVFTGTGIIYPKYNGSTTTVYSTDGTMYVPNRSITFDFTNYQGTFAGVSAASSNNQGSLFGYIVNSTYDGPITIKNLTLNRVNVTPTGSYSYFGGIVGHFKGKNDNTILNFSNCTLVNCSIGNVSGGSYVGGLVGFVETTKVIVNDCNVKYCEILSNGLRVGGMVGYGARHSWFYNCTVENCSVVSLNNNQVGGLIGYNSYPRYYYCKVENCSISGSDEVGGLAGGSVDAGGDPCMKGSSVINCIISGYGISQGGLAGILRNAAMGGVTGCKVENCTITGGEDAWQGYYGVGGFFGRVNNADSSKMNAGNWVNNSAVRGNITNHVGEIFGMPKKDIGDWGENVSKGGEIWVNDNNDVLASPRIIIAKSGDVTKRGPEASIYFNNGQFGEPSIATAHVVTRLQGYGVGGQYEAVAYVYDPAEVNNIVNTSVINGKVYATDVANPTVPITKATICYTTVHLVAVNSTGYHIDWNVTNNKLNEKIVVDASDNFFMPDAEVNIGAIFTGNKTTVNYNNSTTETESVIYTYNSTAIVPAPVRGGYSLGWNLSSESGYPFSGNTTYFKDGKWNYTGVDQGTLNVYANWTLIETNVTVINNIAEFHNENTTVIQSTSGFVTSVVLENISNIENSYANFKAGINNITDIPDIAGTTKEQITIFEINATPASLPARFNVTVTFADEQTATAEKGKIHFWHYNTTNDAWDTPYLTIASMVQTGEKVLYTVETNAFSPFGFGIYTPTPSPSYSSSSSKQTGYTVILSEGQVAPTAYATAAPTVAPTVKPTEKQATPTVIATEKPTTQPTQQSPAPFVGLLAGLGAAALVLTRMRK